jgi:integrase
MQRVPRKLPGIGINLVPIVPQGLDAIGTALPVEPHDRKQCAQRIDAIGYRELGDDAHGPTGAAVADDYIKDMYAQGLRNVCEFEAIIRREFLGQALGNDAKWNDQKEPLWRDRPITEITPEDAARRIKAIKDRGGDPEPGHRRRSSGGPWAAHHALSIGKAWFAWAIDQHAYGLTSSPFERLKPKRIIGAKKPRQRTLSEAELRIVWNAAGKMVGAYGDLVRLLALTGQRLSQTAEIQRAEIDLDRGLKYRVDCEE